MDRLELGWLILMTSSFVTAQQGDSANEEAKNIVDNYSITGIYPNG